MVKCVLKCICASVLTRAAHSLLARDFGGYRGYYYHQCTRNILDCDQSNVLLAHLLHTDRRQDLGDNTSRDIANFSSNFVAMATTLGRGRILLTSFNSPTQKPPDRHKDLGDISHTT